MEGIKKERFFVYNVNTNKDAGYVLRISGVSDKYGERGNLAEISSPFSYFSKNENKSLKSLKTLRVGNICRFMQIILQNFA
jgi:hypothetical protein